MIAILGSLDDDVLGEIDAELTGFYSFGEDASDNGGEFFRSHRDSLRGLPWGLISSPNDPTRAFAAPPPAIRWALFGGIRGLERFRTPYCAQ